MKKGKLAALALSLVMLSGALPVKAAPVQDGYVLMNLPYGAFYQAELGSQEQADAVSAATRQKRTNGGLAKGSYHVGPEGAGVDGVIYPVYVPDLSLLDKEKEVTEDSRVEVSTTARGTTTTTEYQGRDALFEAEDYAWYRLSETPAYYKAMTVAPDGSWSFGAVQGEARTVAGVEAEVTYNGRHTEVELVLSGTDGVQTGDAVSGVIVTTADGSRYGLGHVTNIWRAVELGWNGDDVMQAGNGAVDLTNIRYITPSAILDFPVEIHLAQRDRNGYLDVPSEAWYAPYVDWATAKGYITSARSESAAFDAEQTLTRAEVVTYLWNAAGKPEPESTENPFPQDLEENASYYQAVLWAKEAGITSGTGAASFSPELTVDRATMVTFLWTQAGKPLAKGTVDPFPDVPGDAWYRTAVLWAVEHGVTVGTGEGFSPTQAVSRAQILAFLYQTNDAFTAIAGQEGTSYQNLFELILDSRYDALWEQYMAQGMGVSQAPAGAVEALKSSISSQLYGEAAIAAHSGDGGYQFNCWYINGARRFTFRPDLSATVTLEDGSEQTYHYKYLGLYTVGEGESMTWEGQEFSPAFECDVYQSEEEAGEFTYLFFRDDTMEKTYHIEFRYGSDLEGLQGYFKGPYAYWLSAGIDVDADQETIQKVIELFCLENT